MSATVSGLSNADPQALATAFACFFLLALRLLPLCLLAPFAAAGAAPNLLSFALALVLALCLWPVAQATAAPLALAPLSVLALGLREVLLGLAFALALALPLRALEWSGRIAGRASFVPFAATSYGALSLALGVAAFFLLGGHRVAIAALAHSLVRYPLGAVAALPEPRAFVLSSLRLFADAFSTAVLIALPFAGSLALAELGLALATRTTPALAAALGPLRTAFALALFALCALLFLPVLPDVLATGLRGAERALGGMSAGP